MAKRHAKRFSPKGILEAVCKGIATGGATFSALTNANDPPWSAPEYFLVVHAAKSAKRTAKDYDVWCESSVRTVVGLGDEKRRGRYIKELRRQARFDIAILDRDNFPKVLVEIKRNVTSIADIKNDFRRLEHAMKNEGSTVRAAVIGFLIRALADGRGKGKATLNKRRETLRKGIQQENDDLVTRIFSGRVHKHMAWSDRSERDRLYVWQAVCIYAKRSGQH